MLGSEEMEDQMRAPIFDKQSTSICKVLNRSLKWKMVLNNSQLNRVLTIVLKFSGAILMLYFSVELG